MLMVFFGADGARFEDSLSMRLAAALTPDTEERVRSCGDNGGGPAWSRKTSPGSGSGCFRGRPTFFFGVAYCSGILIRRAHGTGGRNCCCGFGLTVPSPVVMRHDATRRHRFPGVRDTRWITLQALWGWLVK